MAEGSCRRCGKPVRTRGLCPYHYRHVTTYGVEDPADINPPIPMHPNTGVGPERVAELRDLYETAAPPNKWGAERMLGLACSLAWEDGMPDDELDATVARILAALLARWPDPYQLQEATVEEIAVTAAMATRG